MAKQLESEKQYYCNFCNRGFVREKSLIKHVCEQKRRWMNKDEKYVQLGYYAFRRFYELTKASNRRQPPSYEEFMRSKYYLAFTRFGKYLLNISAVNPEGFIDFVIKQGIKLDDWTKDYVYEMYARELCKRESPEKALERGIMLMQQWSMETGENWYDFFYKISPVRAVSWIKRGKLSPWLIYCAKSSRKLFERMSDEQMNLISEYIEPRFWKSQLKNFEQEVKEYKKILEESGV